MRRMPSACANGAAAGSAATDVATNGSAAGTAFGVADFEQAASRHLDLELALGVVACVDKPLIVVEAKLCVYRNNPLLGHNSRIDHLPAAADAQARCKPIYEAMEGWSETTHGARRWADLPAAAIKYVRRVEELIEAPVAILSTSPERDDTILVKDPFAA